MSGHVADYIPQLAKGNPKDWGISIFTIDGQSFDIGVTDKRFCIQSCCKPLNYLHAQKLIGQKEYHKYVGHEPSGRGFNELALNENQLPHNPCINSGAIMTCAVVRSKYPTQDEVYSATSDFYASLCDGTEPGFSNATYLSERRTADRNHCLAYMMVC